MVARVAPCPYTPEIQAMVRALAHRTSAATGGVVPWDDLFSAGEYAIARYLARFDPSLSKFKTWAYAKANFAMKDHLRSLDPHTREERKGGYAYMHVVAYDPEVIHEIPGEDCTRQCETEELKAAALCAIKLLDPVTQRAIDLQYVQGVSERETAHRMRKTVYQVEQITQKGIKELQHHLLRLNARIPQNVREEIEMNLIPLTLEADLCIA